MKIRNLSISEFSYQLPEEKIAKYALKQRDSSKLLQFKSGKISDHIFHEIPNLIPSGSLICFNNTKVIHARILFQKESGTTIEVFCLEPRSHDFQNIFLAKNNCTWDCLIGNMKRWKNEDLLKSTQIKDENIILRARLIEKAGANATVEFTWEGNVSFGDILLQTGLLPLPPYLKRDADELDEIAYQTLYAKLDGSVAAPTAGLHITERVLNNLKGQNILTQEITLHVGAGTFLPVKSETMSGHNMHREQLQVSLDAIKNMYEAIKNEKPIISVGTTTLRTLESIYWHGVKLLAQGQNSPYLDVNQWDPYELPDEISPEKAISAVIENLQNNKLDALTGSTQILIGPGYSFKMVNGLITNFHQPNSTLLLLIAAFVGKEWKEIYAHALNNNYRFLSFGDSSLLFRN